MTDQPDPRPDPAAPSTVVLFDLDGTITDSFTGIVNSFRHALAAVGAPEPDPDVVRGIAGPPMLDTLHLVGLDEDTATAALSAYRARYTDTGWRENAVFDGMADLVGDLHAQGRRLAVATSKNEDTAQVILQHFGLAENFEVIAGSTPDGSRRAKADVIASALTRLGISTDPEDPDRDDVVMIGDRHHDVTGAAHFGIPTGFVKWGYSEPGESVGATWVVDSVEELRRLLGA